MGDVEIKQVDLARVNKDGVYYTRSGRYAIVNGHLLILEDNNNHLTRRLQQGPLDMLGLQQLHSLKNSHRFRVEDDADINTPLPTLPRAPDSTFHLFHDDGSRSVLEFVDGVPHLDSSPVSGSDLHALAESAKSGSTRIRYPGQEVKKMEVDFERLVKGDAAESALKAESALAALEEMKQYGLDENHIRNLRNLIFTDSGTGHVLGNRFAYEAFCRKNKTRPYGGVFLMADVNDFKVINDSFGHAVGDKVLTAIAKALREAAAEEEKSKIWRVGGDEFSAHFETAEVAASFLRKMTEILDEFVPVEGTFRPSLSVGVGDSPEAADKAMYQAKSRKKENGVRVWEPGQVPNLVFSLIPYFEGPVPLPETDVHTETVTES